MAKFTVPNWGQNALIEQAGLQLVAPAVRVDNDQVLWLIDLKDRVEYSINKKTGKVTVR